MNDLYNILGEIEFDQSLSEIKQRLESLKKDFFLPKDKIIIRQNTEDEYLYVDSVGTRLIEIQKIINQVDISNCFILLVTTNTEVSREIDFVTRFYSVDPNPITFKIVKGDYKKHVRRYQNTACRKLWNHFYVGPDGNINPCCLADHRFPLGNINDADVDSRVGNNAQQIRSYMTQGLRVRACASCYENEDRGIHSARLCCDPTTQPIQIQSLDIRLNNICNFKCRMCSEYFSSSIQQETIELYGKNAVLGTEKISLDRTQKKSRQQQLEKIFPLITTDLDSIYFAGGEPLLTIEHYKILDKLLEIKKTDVHINYNTNLSALTFKNLNAIDYWNQFENIKIGASIDASDRAAEYVRHGTIWTDIVRNLCTIKEYASNVSLSITSTVSFLTIENLIRLQTKWINDGFFNADDLEINILTNPNYLSPAALPTHHKQRLTNIIQSHIKWLGTTKLSRQWHDVQKFMNDNDYTYTLSDFRHRTLVLDRHRNESFVEVFPEFVDLYV